MTVMDIETKESRLIAEAHAAVLEQSKKHAFEAAAYERATELLESLASTELVNERVQLALDITVVTRNDYRPDLSRRALYAAFPSEGEITDLRLRRKWFTFAAVIDAYLGHVERAFKYKLAALDLCEQLKDSIGFCVECSNFASLANGAGLFEDAVRYATVAIDTKSDGTLGWLGVRGNALLCRANALMRLGRFAEAESDLLLSLVAVTNPPNASVINRVFMAQYLFAETQLERRDVAAARAALYAASTWATACDLPSYRLQIDRVTARLSGFEQGMEQAFCTLTRLLEKAHDLEATSGGARVDEGVVLDVLHTLEQVHREHGDVLGADRWLEAVGEKLRSNATRILNALVDKPILAGGETIAVKAARVDSYLRSRAAATPSQFEAADSPWTHVIGLAASATAVEDATKEHGLRVARLARLVARELGLPAAMQRAIETCCLLHDIGKVSVPSPVLLKSTALGTEELRLYDAHPVVGAELLERINSPDQSVVRNVIRFHHHPYNGSTVHSEKGEAIPLEARIASICDRYDALVAGRPRRPSISGADALREILEQRSRDFDPNVVDVFIEVVRRLQRSHPDVQAYLSEDADSIEYFAMQRTLKRAADRALMTNAAKT